MPRVFIIPHRENEAVFSRLISKANSSQADFMFHVLPPDDSPNSPMRAGVADFRPILEYLNARKLALGATPTDLLITFFDGILTAREAGLTNLFMAGSRYDELTPCNAVISLRFLSWGILEERFNYDLQRHAFLHLVICGLLGAYTHLQAHHETFGCLLDFNSRLFDFNRKLQRGYYLCSPDERDCHRKVQAERYGNSILQLCSVLKYDIDQPALQIVIGKLVMGDKFENIQNATIINRSLVVEAFNTVKEGLDEATANALVKIAEAVEKSGNHAAGAMFNEFSTEMAKPTRDKGKLRQYWEGLLAILPNLATLAEAAGKVAELFAAK